MRQLNHNDKHERMDVDHHKGSTRRTRNVRDHTVHRTPSLERATPPVSKDDQGQKSRMPSEYLFGTETPPASHDYVAIRLLPRPKSHTTTTTTTTVTMTTPPMSPNPADVYPTANNAQCSARYFGRSHNLFIVLRLFRARPVGLFTLYGGIHLVDEPQHLGRRG